MQPAEPLPSLRLTLYINAFACAALAVFASLPRLALQSRRAASSSATPEEKQPMVGTSNDSNGASVSEGLQVCNAVGRCDRQQRVPAPAAMVVSGSLRSSEHALTWRDPLGIAVSVSPTSMPSCCQLSTVPASCVFVSAMYL